MSKEYGHFPNKLDLAIAGIGLAAVVVVNGKPSEAQTPQAPIATPEANVTKPPIALEPIPTAIRRPSMDRGSGH